VVILFLNLQKNTQLIDSKNKQVLPSTRDESSIHPEYSGALVLICSLISSYNTVPPDPEFSGGIGMSFSEEPK